MSFIYNNNAHFVVQSDPLVTVHNHFPALVTRAPTGAMAETLIENTGIEASYRLEKRIAVGQVTRPIPLTLKLLLASTIFLVILVLGTIVYFIYAKYANE